ncbi:MAG: hypothetical protein HC945_00085 [Nitrosarchaeum sp.]|nr:hypothetical protein [Nitrosarchaeum sp.]
MMKSILRILDKEFNKFIEKLLENPIRNILVLIVSGYIMFAFAQYFYQYLSIITLVTYVLFCLKGITKIIDDPRRTVVWAVGFVIGATAVKMIFENLLPTINFKDIASIISVLVIGYVILAFYLKSKELKSY